MAAFRGQHFTHNNQNNTSNSSSISFHNSTNTNNGNLRGNNYVPHQYSRFQNDINHDDRNHDYHEEVDDDDDGIIVSYLPPSEISHHYNRPDATSSKNVNRNVSSVQFSNSNRNTMPTNRKQASTNSSSQRKSILQELLDDVFIMRGDVIVQNKKYLTRTLETQGTYGIRQDMKDAKGNFNV